MTCPQDLSSKPSILKYLFGKKNYTFARSGPGEKSGHQHCEFLNPIVIAIAQHVVEESNLD